MWEIIHTINDNIVTTQITAIKQVTNYFFDLNLEILSGS